MVNKEIKDGDIGQSLSIAIERIDSTVQETEMTKKINEWLSTFNTDSATACFTAVQELKKKVSI